MTRVIGIHSDPRSLRSTRPSARLASLSPRYSFKAVLIPAASHAITYAPSRSRIRQRGICSQPQASSAMFSSSSLVISKPASVNRRGLIFSAIKQFSIRSAYRCLLSASVITPAATTTVTMTVASASIEARVSYQLFQSSSMRWSLTKARPALRKFHCVERTCLCDRKCNATFRRAAF